jgi:hypothetical protein
VVAKLIEVELATGMEKTRVTFDSSAFPAAKAYHTDQAQDCTNSSGFDFVNKAYYIEVTLTHSSIAAGGAAGVQVIKIVKKVCIV